jgi:hypothetical protein
MFVRRPGTPAFSGGWLSSASSSRTLAALVSLRDSLRFPWSVWPATKSWLIIGKAEVWSVVGVAGQAAMSQVRYRSATVSSRSCPQSAARLPVQEAAPLGEHLSARRVSAVVGRRRPAMRAPENRQWSQRASSLQRRLSRATAGACRCPLLDWNAGPLASSRSRS